MSRVDLWKSQFGDDYIDRNAPDPDVVSSRARGFAEILRHASPRPESMLEVGSNIGLNLRALRGVTTADLTAIEPNATARAGLIADGVLPKDRVLDGSTFAIDLPDGGADLVFTCGVLIHVTPDDRAASFAEMYRVSNRHILAVEYFSQVERAVPYRGQTDALWTADFGAMWLDACPDLVPVQQGFFWKRTTGFDDATWWLFRKP